VRVELLLIYSRACLSVREIGEEEGEKKGGEKKGGRRKGGEERGEKGEMERGRTGFF